MAKNTFADLVSFSPAFWDAYDKLGRLYYADGDKEAASKIFEELLRKNPSYEKKDEIEKWIID